MTKLADRIKRAFKSWTINWHLVLVVVGGIQQTQADWMPWLESVLTKDRVGLVIAGLGIIGLVLRFKTTKPISER